MLPNAQSCRGPVSRRDFLQVGALSVGGLSMAGLLQAEAQGGQRARPKSVIMIYMAGAPSHQDMVDLKPEAPLEYRGEFQPTATKVPGMFFCEHLPRLGRIADKLAIIRSLHGSPDGDHDSFICYTGRSKRVQPPGGWPALGSAVSKLKGPSSPDLPAFVGLAPRAGHPPYGSPGLPGFLGPAHHAFRPYDEALADLQLQGITVDRLAERRDLLARLDGYKRVADNSGAMAALDQYTSQALGLLTSSRVVDALDLTREDPKVRARYGQGDPKNYGDGAPRNLEHFLVARRLVEAGVRVVTLNFGRWDFHSDNFNELKNTHLPQFDQGLSALIEDLHERGLDQDVAVVAWGEFGRTPVINKDAGRDHWPAVGCGFLAGGGFRTGQVIGATDRLAGSITERPVHYGEVLATLYQHLGLDYRAASIRDLAGRPHYLVEAGHHPLAELS